MNSAAQEIERARDALHHIDPNLPRDKWHAIGRSAIAAGLTVDDLVAWSRPAANFKSEQDVRVAFRTIKPDGGTGPGLLFKTAKANGWIDTKSGLPQPEEVAAGPTAQLRTPADGRGADEVYARCEVATEGHAYVAAKSAAGVPLDDLRVVPAGDPLRILGESMAAALVVPVRRADGTLSTLQFITTGDTATRLKEKIKTNKVNLPNCSVQGWYVVGELYPGAPVYVVEGIGQAWSCWQATGHAAVVSFGAGRMRAVATELRERDPTARIVIVPDKGKEADAEQIARDVRAAVACMPEGEPSNLDANDYAQREGLDALELLLEQAREPEPSPLVLSVSFADELPDIFTPPDELVQGLLTADAGSVPYGDSNSDKTFFVIDLAAAVARGVPWLDRLTESGLVVYLAAESPASVRSRLQAYQRHHGCKVPNFAVVQTPLDLFDGDGDTDRVIELVRQLEARREQKVRLIVGDTLARLSAGANENAGQDMGLVVRRFDRIRTECRAHFLLIHHSGKAAANGARGWSGIRAAVDTEIKVTDSPQGRCAEITKQRDLSTKGERIGFRLESVTLGVTKWGAPATSCVVVSMDAPERPQARRVSEVGGAVLEYLRTQSAGVKKRVLVKHFEALYVSSAVYRELKKLVKAGVVHETAGMLAPTENWLFLN